MNRPKKEKSNTFKSPVDWYIAGIMIRFEVVERNRNNLNQRVTAWENQHLIKEKSPDEAYKKAIKIGKESESQYVNTDGKNVRWIFEGLTTLIAVYEKLEDGAEIIWTEYENRAAKTIKRKIKSKEELEVFQKD